MKELFLTTITKTPELIVNKFFFLCVCFFLLVFMQWLEPTLILFKWPYLGQYSNLQEILCAEILVSIPIYKVLEASTKQFHQLKSTKSIMLPGHCTLRNILQINKGQPRDLNQVREDLDDLCYHEPARCREVTAKLNIVNEMLRDKLAEPLSSNFMHRIRMWHLPPRPRGGLRISQPKNLVSHTHKKNPGHQTGPWQGPANSAPNGDGSNRTGRNACGWLPSIYHSLHSY